MYKFNSNQVGGTVFGLICGLIIGLAIAVVVAIMITKTPTPFTNKVVKQEKTPSVIGIPSEATPTQLPDPNKLLYGNQEPPKEITKSFTPPPSAIKNKDNDNSDEIPTIDKSNTDKNKKTAAEIADAKTSATSGNWIYFLQVGAFREQAEAENTKAKLALLGIEARISEHQADNGTLYRVRVGPFNQLETMNRMRSNLSDNGVNVAVVRSAK